MNPQVLFVSMALAGCTAADAPTYSNLSVDVSNLPKERQFVRGVILSRVWARTPLSAGATLGVRFDMDAAISVGGVKG